ncbi:hypothetical protein D3C73_727170 [compost metagenome]
MSIYIDELGSSFTMKQRSKLLVSFAVTAKGTYPSVCPHTCDEVIILIGRSCDMDTMAA